MGYAGMSFPFGIAEVMKSGSIAAMQDLGVEWVRVDFIWPGIEATQGTFTWSSYDTCVAAVESAGMKVLPILDQTPSWARSGGTSWTKPTLNSTYATFCAAAATRYRPGGTFGSNITAYEIWNEPNNGTFWPSGPNPTEYAAMLLAARNAIHAVDSSLKVVGGATSPHGVAGNYTDLSWPPGFCNAVINAGGLFDAWSHHPYNAGGFGDNADSAWTNLDTNSTGPRNIRGTLDAAGLTACEIWGTEFGFLVPDWQTEANAASLLGQAYDLWKAKPYPRGPLFCFTLRSGSVSTGDPGGFSIMDPVTGAHLLRYAAYKSHAPSAPTPPPTTFPTTGLLDDFNRGDNSSLGGNWSLNAFGTGQAPGIQTNQAYNPSGVAAADALWTASTVGPDCEAWATISTAANDADYFFFARMTGTSGNGYAVNIYVGNPVGHLPIMRLYKITGGVKSQMGANTAITIASGDQFGFSCVGSTITGWLKNGGGAWTQIITATDATYSAANYIGMQLDGGNIENFSGGTVVVTSSTNQDAALLGVGN